MVVAGGRPLIPPHSLGKFYHQMCFSLLLPISPSAPPPVNPGASAALASLNANKDDMKELINIFYQSKALQVWS